MAFPGAEGFGSATPGGRGGKIIRVTTLADHSNPGSLRYALTAKGPRIVVFDVAGTIKLKKYIRIDGADRSYLTVAGQTAPGGGICVADAPLLIGGYGDSVHDIVIRHLRIRTGATGKKKGSWEPDALGINNAYNVIIDHCSISWGVDENLSITSFKRNKANAIYQADGATHSITVQHSLIAEGLQYSTHSKGPHSKGLMVAYGPTKVTLHHNLIMHSDDRNPYLPAEGTKPYIIDVVNNVVYNWGKAAGIAYEKTNHNGNINLVGNFYRKGPNSKTVPMLTLGVSAKVYAKANIGAVRNTFNVDDWKAVKWTKAKSTAGLKMKSPFSAPKVTTQYYADAYKTALANVGATVPQRDMVDTRLILELQAKKGKIINSPSQVGGWPPLAPGTPPLDTDDDGMPDAWEVTRGFDPKNAKDGNGDKDGDGYTNVEDYLNELCPPDYPKKP